MDDNLDIPEESMRHIEALLARHRPDMIHRMFQQAMESSMFSPQPTHVQYLTQSRTQLCRILSHSFFDINNCVNGLVVSLSRSLVSHVDNDFVPLTPVHAV